MTPTTIDEATLQRALKAALGEALREQRDLLREVFSEVLEDFAMSEAIREGQKTRTVERGDVFRILRGDS